jgi:hypothetical protein
LSAIQLVSNSAKAEFADFADFAVVVEEKCFAKFANSLSRPQVYRVVKVHRSSVAWFEEFRLTVWLDVE